ncbi:MAG: hypothetical protein EOP84_34435 [Verrucomicrobiaceae bacterium]|nr:MAG: hypothetical protein EOP84_34435 [Verrucomicrobiaceae bacterium]
MDSAGKAADDRDKDAARIRMAFLAILLDWDQARGREKITEQSAKWQKDRAWLAEPRGAFLSFIYKASGKSPEILPVCEEVVWKLSSGDYTGFSHKSAFTTQLMLKHGASLKRPAADLWTHPDSPWCLQSLRVSSVEDVVGYWRDQELIRTLPFRDLLDSLLTDDKSCGTVSLDPAKPGEWTAEINLDKTTQKIPEDKKFALKPGTKLSLRRKDIAGRKLKQPKYAGEKTAEPLLEYYWSLEDRDKWLEKLRSELKSAKPIGVDR